MKENLKKITSFIKSKWLSLTTSIMMASAGVIPVFAGGVDAQAAPLVGKLVGIVCDIFRYIGILLLVWGVGQLVLAFKNEDADSKSRAMMLIVASIILMSLKALINSLGLNITIA